ncbi:class I SAM-dependent methyltransferase [Proteinivorax tanatarense]|uniref:Class I SAM-dependent methyltransferase n=1 Tax=Proteinivorax tanatarense TaxID=1260629 RepID=A0AAU7VKH3_9FIRM
MLNWMDVTNVSFNSLMLLEEVQISWLKESNVDHEKLALALNANPHVEWYLRNKCLEINPWVDAIMKKVKKDHINNPQRVRQAEISILESLNDWIVYVVNPAVYDLQPFLNWDSQELTSVVDFTDKRVIDVGAGTGRLTFVAAQKAKTVYAVEPVWRLRKYLKEKIKEKGYDNIYVVDGLAEEIPFPDNFADATINAHVFGDKLEEHYQEFKRVTKPGGKIVMCPGNGDRDNKVHQFLIDKGFEWGRFEQPRDGMMRKYWLGC